MKNVVLEMSSKKGEWDVQVCVCITGFSAVKEGELLFQHSLKHQLLDGAVYVSGCDIIHEVTHQLKDGTEM